MNERIKHLRNVLNLTQQEFADKISVKRNTVATYEMGRREPHGAVISLICNTFDVNEEWLRNGTGKMFLEFSRDEEISRFIGEIQRLDDNEFKKRFISVLSQLGETEWEVLEEMAKKLAEEK